MNKDLYEIRQREFSALWLHGVAQNNPIVRRCIEAYAHGQILTREECLMRMVNLLATDWIAKSEENVRCYQSMAKLIFPEHVQ